MGFVNNETKTISRKKSERFSQNPFISYKMWDIAYMGLAFAIISTEHENSTQVCMLNLEINKKTCKNKKLSGKRESLQSLQVEY